MIYTVQPPRILESMPSDGNASLESAVDDDDLTQVDDDVTQIENSLIDDDLTQVNSSTQVDGDNDMTSADCDVDPLMTQNEQSESLTEHGSMVEDSKKIKRMKLSKKKLPWRGLLEALLINS